MIGNPSKSLLCRGPDLNRRHMVLQVTSPAIRKFAPEPRVDDAWLRLTTNGSTKWTASRHVGPGLGATRRHRQVVDLQTADRDRRRAAPSTRNFEETRMADSR